MYTQGNKLGTYKLFKYEYLLRCGVAPFWIETGRCERKEINERTCFYFNNSIEDELHVHRTIEEFK